MKKIIFAVVIMALIAGGVFVVIDKQKNLSTLPKPSSQPPAVQTAIAAAGSIDVKSRQIGEVQAYVQADVAPRIMGYILSITKREGDPVTKGEIVCTVDDRELSKRAESSQAEVLATKQRLAGARSVYETQRSVTERDEKLYTAGAISKEALERSRSSLDSAKAAVDAYEESIHGLERNVEAARLQVGYSQIEAPFSGIVTKRSADPGDLAVPGKAILTIQQPSPVKLVVQVPQELIGRMGPGSKLLLSNGSSTLQVSATKVYPALGKNLLGSVEVVLPKSPFGLPTGSTVAVDIVTVAAAGVIVPESAVFRTEKGAFVYTVIDGTVHARQVEVLGLGDRKAVVKGGVVPGTQVAVAQENKLLTLAEGMKITTAGGKQ